MSWERGEKSHRNEYSFLAIDLVIMDTRERIYLPNLSAQNESQFWNSWQKSHFGLFVMCSQRYLESSWVKFTPTFRVVRREHQSGHPNCRFATQIVASNPEGATINFQPHRWSRYISLLSYKLGWVAVFSANSPAYAGQGWEITRLSSFVHG